MYPGSFGKARMISPGFYFLGIKTIPAVYGEDRDPLKASENVCQLIFAFLTLRPVSLANQFD